VLFHETPLAGAYIVELEKRGDERGFFARVFCRDAFEKVGLTTRLVQVNTSLSADEGTLRGMHYQLAPHAETKIVRCIHGAMWDCILDLRPNSPTFGKWFAETLTPENRRMMYVPKGFGHGFVTLEPSTEAFYFVDEFYHPESERGVRWNDPKFGIDWPVEPHVISAKDASHRDFDPAWHLANS
jgi:dTDP-4-dehydrorhamnose 3,5-epimerase